MDTIDDLPQQAVAGDGWQHMVTCCHGNDAEQCAQMIGRPCWQPIEMSQGHTTVWFACAAGTSELIFTPKFATSLKAGHAPEGRTQQHPRSSAGSSCPSSLGPDVQRHHSQCTSCSTGSTAPSVEGAAFHTNCATVGLGSAASGGIRDAGRGSGSSDKSRCFAASGFDTAAAGDAGRSSSGNLFGSASLLQGPLGAGQGRPLDVHGMDPNLVSREQAAEQLQRRVAFNRQYRQQQQPMGHWFPDTGLQHRHMAGPRMLDEAGTALGSGSMGVMNAYLPTFRPLQPSHTFQGRADALAVTQPTSLSVLPPGAQQEQLGLPLPGTLCGMAALPPCAAVLPSGMFEDRPFTALAGFGLMPMLPQGADSGSSLPTLPSAFANPECLSTYSNFLDNHPSMQLAHARVSASEHLVGLSAAVNYAAEAAAADCSASLLASGAAFGCSRQQQHSQAHATELALHSSSNLQLSTGALHHGAGSTWEDGNDMARLQQEHMLMLDGNWSPACDSGYFDLYKSTSSSVESVKNDATGVSDSSCPNKLSNCSSAADRAPGSAAVSALALIRQQQDQLLLMQEQQQQLQLSGLPVGPQSAMPLGAFVGTPQGLLASPTDPSLSCQHVSGSHLQWPQQPPMMPGGGLLPGMELPAPGHVAPLIDGGSKAGSAAKGEEEMTTAELPASTAAVAAVAEHITSITELTGAAVLIAAPAGQLSLKLLGTPSQVQLAASVIHLLLQKQRAAANVAGS